MIEGRYHDIVLGADGRVEDDRGWGCNVIARTAWPLVAALLRNDASMGGIMYCAVGEGEAVWDTARPAAQASATRLRAEVRRLALEPAAFSYLDVRGRRVEAPTEWLEISARFTWPAGRRVLREFGLFGGNATPAHGSGYMVNHVIHPPIELRAGQTLLRRVRFSLQPGRGEAPADVIALPAHWLDRESPRLIDGVGDAILAALARLGIATIGQLAAAPPLDLAAGFSVTRAIELRAKARLALRTAARLPVIAGADDLRAHEIMEVDAVALGTVAGIAPEDAEALQERLALLQLALDARSFRRMTLHELREGG